MVSNLPSPPHHPNTITHIPSKKRKLEADLEEACYQQVDYDSKLSLWMNTRPQKSSAMDEIPSAPPSPNTQQQQECLYSTGTHKRSSERATGETLGLDLELNLTCGDHLQQNATKLNRRKSIISSGSNNELIPPTLSLLSPSPAAAADEQEMVAAACKRCHLLVMLSKSYPSCPNCKFMHPTHHHTPPNLIAQPKPTSLLC